MDHRPSLIVWKSVESEAKPTPLTGPRLLRLWGRIADTNSSRSPSATESHPQHLLALYERFQLDAPIHVVGTAAWVIEDPRNNRLIAVRDRLGTRGLCYTKIDGALHIAERVEDLLAAFDSAPALDRVALAAQVCGDVPDAESTFFENLRMVPPGAFLLASGDQVEIHRYWSPEAQPLLRLKGDEEYAQAVAETLGRVVAQYNFREPAAVALSSGFDSGVVAACLVAAVGARDDRLKALIWSAPELPTADETFGAEAAAAGLGLAVQQIRADREWTLRQPLESQVRRGSPLCGFFEGVWSRSYEELRADGRCVLYTGVGGDHLFGADAFGYPDLLLTGRWLRLARDLRQHSKWSPRSVPRILRQMIWAPIRQWARGTVRRPIVPWLREPYRKDRLAERGLGRVWQLPGRVQRLRTLDDLLIAPYVVDASQRAAEQGIELSHPLLDHRLFELAARLPTDQTFEAGERKVVLRRGFHGRLPSAVLDRRDKIYPGAIVQRGLRERESEAVVALMTDMRAAEMGLVDEIALRRTYAEYRSGETDRAIFWHTLTLEAWLRKYF